MEESQIQDEQDTIGPKAPVKFANLAWMPVSEDIVLNLLDFEGGSVVSSRTDQYGTVYFLIKHSDLPEDNNTPPVIRPEYIIYDSGARGSIVERYVPKKTQPDLFPPEFAGIVNPTNVLRAFNELIALWEEYTDINNPELLISGIGKLIDGSSDKLNNATDTTTNLYPTPPTPDPFENILTDGYGDEGSEPDPNTSTIISDSLPPEDISDETE